MNPWEAAANMFASNIGFPIFSARPSGSDVHTYMHMDRQIEVTAAGETWDKKFPFFANKPCAVRSQRREHKHNQQRAI